MASSARYRLGQLAELVGGHVQGDPAREIDGLQTLSAAGPRDLSFATHARYRREAAASRAGALLVRAPIRGVDKDFLVAEDPYYALAQLLDLMFSPLRPAAGVHPTAIVGRGVEIDPSASVGPYAVVGERSRLGAGVVLFSHVVIGRDCRIGPDSVLYPRVVLYDGCSVGERCILHAGVVLGSDGYGYAQHGGRHKKLRHAGRVVVENDVEIGANTTIDRALLDETRIGAGTKIDNLVQVAHNVRLGESCLLIAQSGIAGSSRLGSRVVLAGQVGVAGHLELGDGVQVAAKSAVFRSVDPGEEIAGIPARGIKAWRRQQALVGRLQDFKKRLERLESAAIDTDEEGTSE